MPRIAEANALYRAGDFGAAAALYHAVIQESPALADIFIRQALDSDQRFRLAVRCSVARSRPRAGIYRVFSMVRDEIDIVDSWLRHCLELFDEVLIIDHASIDGTREFLIDQASSSARIKLFLYDELGYNQAKVINYVLRNEVSFAADDWAFFLDVDEFLPFVRRDDFTFFVERAEAPSISLGWVNVFPVEIPENGLVEASKFRQRCRIGPTRKVAFRPANATVAGCGVDQGAHRLVRDGRTVGSFAFGGKIYILHVPIRSAGQIQKKLANGVSAYKNLGSARQKNHGWHWFRMWERFVVEGCQVSTLAREAFFYNERERFVPLIEDNITARSISFELLSVQPRQDSAADVELGRGSVKRLSID